MIDVVEPINVWVLFKKSAIYPHIFFWRNRKIKVDSINLVHTSKDGDSIVYHFSISSSGNFYRLMFHLKSLKWFLEAVEEEI
ncbi:hypothetical protein HYS93_02905 [Candidatus Daviesbacteria bacterium]|nr:hypothetical protein [Candidatus Daviesbacteria bacterium]